MKATELRIGNYVNYDDMVVGILCDMVETIKHPENLLDDIEPIPLTQEWIVNLGGSVLEYGYDDGAILILEYGRFKLIWKPKYNYWYVVDGTNDTYLTKIEFVHEWQNFVFIMDGNELTLKQ